MYFSNRSGLVLPGRFAFYMVHLLARHYILGLQISGAVAFAKAENKHRICLILSQNGLSRYFIHKEFAVLSCKFLHYVISSLNVHQIYILYLYIIMGLN